MNKFPFRKWLILAHRYLGIGVSALFVMWFVSGIAMIFARGMPGLTPDVRLQRLPDLDLSAVRLTPSEAVDKAQLGRAPSRAMLLTIMDRPAYRFGSRETVTVFADTGEVLDEIGEPQAMQIASRFMNLPQAKLRYAGQFTEP